jgi:enoyl-CoA hydratase/carnithine racemase
MLATGDFIDAAQAQAWGLINRVAPDEQLDQAVQQLVEQIIGKPRLALAMGKELFYRQLEVGMSSAYEDAAQTMACNMMDASALEGVQAFLEKRRPAW